MFLWLMYEQEIKGKYPCGHMESGRAITHNPPETKLIGQKIHHTAAAWVMQRLGERLYVAEQKLPALAKSSTNMKQSGGTFWICHQADARRKTKQKQLVAFTEFTQLLICWGIVVRDRELHPSLFEG